MLFEKILWYLFMLDALAYSALTLTARWHGRKSHYFWKRIPLHWSFAMLYIFLISWIGVALYRLGVLF